MDTRLNNTALLVMDLHLLHRLPEQQRQPLVDVLQKTIAAARSAGIPIIYVVVGFRKGLPEVSMRNKRFGAMKQNSLGMDQPPTFPSGLAPQPEDVIVTKRRFSAFTGSDLEVVLRAGEIWHLVLTGISTSGVVLSTLREAADKDLQLTVLSDGCADGDSELHSVLLTKVFPSQAEVLTADQWIEGIRG